LTNDEIKELLRIFNESGVGELELQRGKDRLRIRKNVTETAPPVLYMPSGAAPAAPAAGPAAHAESAAPSPAPETNQVLVKSPIVGTFYESPSPGDPPFVKVGDRVQPGQVLCIIESMKLMNEIEAEVAGVISARLVENGRAVEYGEALYAISPE
jgi:acetyl-CoA carboxylase biotin carboxyl carrier protein